MVICTCFTVTSPRKGTETIVVEPSKVERFTLQLHHPARGRKHNQKLPIRAKTAHTLQLHHPARGRKPQGCREHSPQYSRFTVTSPRKGTETPIVWVITAILALQHPARGRKRFCGICNLRRLSSLQLHHPARGRKQRCRSLKKRWWLYSYITPQGDGNEKLN